MPFRFGGWEIILVLVVVLIIFGAGRLPEIGGALGKGIREFRQGSSGEAEAKELEEGSPKRKARAKSRTKSGSS